MLDSLLHTCPVPLAPQTWQGTEMLHVFSLLVKFGLPFSIERVYSWEDAASVFVSCPGCTQAFMEKNLKVDALPDSS